MLRVEAPKTRLIQFGNAQAICANQTIRASLRIDSRDSGHRRRESATMQQKNHPDLPRSLVFSWQATSVGYFRNPCDRDPPTGNFRNFKFFKNPLKILNVYFWGTKAYSWGERTWFSGFLEFLFLLLWGFGTPWVGRPHRGFQKYLTQVYMKSLFAKSHAINFQNERRHAMEQSQVAKEGDGVDDGLLVCNTTCSK